MACLVASSACLRVGEPAKSESTGPQQSVAAAALAPPPPPATPPPRVTPLDDSGAGSPLLLADVEGRRVAYLADALDSLVRVFDAETLAEIGSVDPGGSPAQLAMGRDGHVFASLRDKNEIVVIEGVGAPRAPLEVVARAKTPAEPIGLALTVDGSTLLVACGWGHALSGFATATLAHRFDKELDREPRAVVASDDGKRAFVSHAVGAVVDVVDLTDERKSKRASMKTTGSVEGEEGSTMEVPLGSGQGFALARSIHPAGRVFAPHARVRSILVRPERSPSGYGDSDFGPTEEFNVAVLDEDTGVTSKRSLETDGGLRCVLPRAAAVTRGGELLVACVGTNQVIALDAAALNPHEAVTRAWDVPAGPMGIAVDDAPAPSDPGAPRTGPRALVWSEFAHALTWVALAGKGSLELASAHVERRTPDAADVEAGRLLFYASDQRISGDHRACASCHPDGRDDGLVWATPDGPRNPPMLAGRLDGSAPYGWLGRSALVTDHLKKTFKRLGGKGLVDDQARALVAYLRAMPVPHAAPVDETESATELVREGERIYGSNEVGCASCHGDHGDAPDMMSHNVRSWAGGDVRGAFDTPSLRFLAGTAPYFHDGRYASLDALLSGTKTTMGHTAQLTSHERAALVAYLRTL